jgi:beta-phosphoglucomutase-like phosphatase (HAD superfamily)
MSCPQEFAIPQSSNLGSLFIDKIFFIDDVGGKRKLSPNIFLHTVRILQSKVEECVVIEDTLLGITAAKRVGMKGIAITTTYNKEKSTGSGCDY